MDRERIAAVARELGFTEEQLPLVQEPVRQAIQVTDDLITRVGPIEPDSRHTQADWVDPPAEPASPPSQPHPDRYEDIGLLGIGGMGEVRRVRDRLTRPSRAALVSHLRLSERGRCSGLELPFSYPLPACSSAYILSSSRNPRQFIQRRGRVLRRAPGKQKARIWDFIILPPADSSEDAGVRRKLVQNELERVWEFASLSNNPSSALVQLRDVIDEYELNHVLSGGDTPNATPEWW